MLGSDQIKNTYDFRYLGVMFQSDCCMLHAVEVRLAVARERFNKLSNIWNSPLLSRRVKLQLYECAVCSIMSHGHESWKLDVRTMAKINGWNARCLSILAVIIELTAGMGSHMCGSDPNVTSCGACCVFGCPGAVELSTGV